MSSPPLGLWIKHIPADTIVTVTPPTKVLVANACLSYSLPEGKRGRGTLLYAEHGAGDLVSVASLVKDIGEQVHLDLVLEAHESYAFAAKGPYPIDLVGYYPVASLGPLDIVDLPPPDDPSNGDPAPTVSEYATKPKDKRSYDNSIRQPSGSNLRKSNVQSKAAAATPDRASTSHSALKPQAVKPSGTAALWASSLFGTG